LPITPASSQTEIAEHLFCHGLLLEEAEEMLLELLEELLNPGAELLLELGAELLLELEEELLPELDEELDGELLSELGEELDEGIVNKDDELLELCGIEYCLLASSNVATFSSMDQIAALTEL